MRMLLAFSILVAAVAALDAARGGHWDQFALLCALAAIASVVLVGTGRTVRPRRDLMNWVEQQAALTDDDPTRIVDRALAAYRAQMLPEADDGRAGS